MFTRRSSIVASIAADVVDMKSRFLTDVGLPGQA
jgi:hypothetical protein